MAKKKCPLRKINIHLLATWVGYIGTDNPTYITFSKHVCSSDQPILNLVEGLAQ